VGDKALEASRKTGRDATCSDEPLEPQNPSSLSDWGLAWGQFATGLSPRSPDSSSVPHGAVV